jgi:hypothetical protein
MLMFMSMSKRIQIPTSESEYEHLKRAARREGLPLAEWSRRLLRQGAERTLGAERLSPEAALKALAHLALPLPHREGGL